MLAYAPFETEAPPGPRPYYVPSSPIRTDRTECNYLVMFFVLGVVLIAISDNV
jgi:hypothetical protein